MAYCAILFDLDGTLLDTLRDIADATNTALASFGFPQRELDAYRNFIRDGVRMLATRALPQSSRDRDTVDSLVSKIDEAYSLNWDKNTRLFEGIPELLDSITRAGIRMAVLSNKGQRFAEMTVSKLLPDWQFEPVMGAQSSVPRKPDPAAALELARRMGIDPADFLYLGDSGVDMKTAVSAGMYPVGVLWGYRTAVELLAGGARALVEEPKNVLSLLTDWQSYSTIITPFILVWALQ